MHGGPGRNAFLRGGEAAGKWGTAGEERAVGTDPLDGAAEEPRQVPAPALRAVGRRWQLQPRAARGPHVVCRAAPLPRGLRAAEAARYEPRPLLSLPRSLTGEAARVSDAQHPGEHPLPSLSAAMRISTHPHANERDIRMATTTQPGPASRGARCTRRTAVCGG